MKRRLLFVFIAAVLIVGTYASSVADPKDPIAPNPSNCIEIDE